MIRSLLMAYEISLPDGAVISDDRTRLDLAFIHGAQLMHFGPSAGPMP
jgi:hypothetical protein